MLTDISQRVLLSVNGNNYRPISDIKVHNNAIQEQSQNCKARSELHPIIII